MSVITREKFINYSQKLMKEGAKVCPCCLHNGLEFTTDDDHSEYWLQCKICNIGIRNHLFANCRRSWNYRQSDDEKINKITHNITCEWFNGEETEYVTCDEEELEGTS